MGSTDELRFEMDRLVSYDEASIIAEIQRVATRLGPAPITQDAFQEVARVSPSTCVRRFGGWREALAAAGLEDRYAGRPISERMRDQRARALTREDIIAELQKAARKIGRDTVTRKDVLRHTQLGERLILNRFGSWQTALEAAGLKLSPHGRRWTEEDYFENLLAVWTHHGRAPKYAEMNDPPSKITKGAYAAKFGTWGKAKLAFVERVNADLSHVERPRVTPEPPVPTPKRESRNTESLRIGVRYQVLRRDRFRCVLCGRSPATDLGCVLHVDHVHPRALGGTNDLDNLRTLCEACNVGKGARIE